MNDDGYGTDGERWNRRLTAWHGHDHLKKVCPCAVVFFVLSRLADRWTALEDSDVSKGAEE